jgi:16S rRNA (guanine527-N7)-methyltransferase
VNPRVRSQTAGWSFFLPADPAGLDGPAAQPAGLSPSSLWTGAAPVPPPEARAVFGPALAAVEEYVGLLAGAGVAQGLLGPREVPRLWTRHVLNCAAIAELVPRPSTLVDLGSGAGLPGVVLALLLPDVEVTLLERMERRAAFLQECVRLLGLPNAQVRCGRAEDLAGALTADVVTARAVAPMERLAGLALGLVRPGGLVLAIKGAGAAEEVANARRVLRRLGVRDVTVLQAGGREPELAATVVRLTAP